MSLVDPPEYAGAVPPDRAPRLRAADVELQLHEWGDPDAAPVVLCHGMFDHGRAFDLLAPLLAERFRVVALTARGHGDSSWADSYLWPGDVEDIGRVLKWLDRPAHLIGHSKGGGQATDAAGGYPQRVRQLVNLDGFGPPDDGGFSRPGRENQATMSIPERFEEHLDRRRGAASRRGFRVYPEFDQLVERRRLQNPRLSNDWLRYFVFHAARPVEGGWLWKADPYAGQGFGPFKPEWIAPGWRRVRAPMLAVIGSEQDTWGPIPEKTLADRLSHVAKLERASVADAGHFMHMEKPVETAALILSFLDR